MKILSIKNSKFKVGAVVQERSSGALGCSLLDDLLNIETTYEASRDRLMAHFEQVSERGLKALNTAQCHQIDPVNKIFEFIAGRLRVLFFSGSPGNVVVCTHMFLKKTAKTPTEEVTRAVKARNAYLKDLAAGRLEWKDEI